MLTIDLSGRVALVVGGSRGIGAAVTDTLCRAGACVTFTHTGNPAHGDRVRRLVARIEAQGGSVKAVTLDARDSANTKLLADHVAEAHGRLDLLVCNPGRNVARPAESVSDDDWLEGIRLNLSSAFFAVRAVLPHMLAARCGRILLIGSSAVHDGGGGAVDYAAAKAGLHGMMRYLVKNYARKGVITNIIDPCVIETDLLGERYATAASKEALREQIPVGRLGKPEDIAGLVAYLASSWGDYICGQAILVDGGRTFGRWPGQDPCHEDTNTPGSVAKAGSRARMSP